MAKKVELKDNKSKELIYPITHSNCVIDGLSATKASTIYQPIGEYYTENDLITEEEVEQMFNKIYNNYE